MFWAFYIKYPISTINLSYIIYIKRIIGKKYKFTIPPIYTKLILYSILTV